MNSVFLSGRLEAPIQVMSSEDAPLHIKAAVRVPHFTAAGIRKSDMFTLSAWRGIAKRFMDQARVGSNIVFEGYLSNQSSTDSSSMEVTITEFRISNKENHEKQVFKSIPTITGAGISNEISNIIETDMNSENRTE